jgi:hypothetical protein
VRTGNHSEWPVVRPAFIEMEPDGKDVTQDVCWRVDVIDARPDCPRAKSGKFPPFTNHDGQVLVPDNLPVRLLGLVEERSFDREAILSENGLGQDTNGSRASVNLSSAQSTTIAQLITLTPPNPIPPANRFAPTEK